MQAEFSIQNLSVKYGKQFALQNFSLEIEKGGVYFLLGPNGSGKSTLLQCLMGSLWWDQGEVYRRGENRKLDRENFNEGLVLIAENILPPAVSIHRLKSLYKEIYGKWNEEQYQCFFKNSQINEKQTLSEVSRGQKIQALLALSMAIEPEVLLIDEATAVLDPYVRNRFIYEIMKVQKQRRMTLVLATNIATEIANFDGHLVILKKGRVELSSLTSKAFEGFAKIRTPSGSFDKSDPRLSFLRVNTDGTTSWIGREEELKGLQFGELEDRRSITVEEIFIYYSDRRGA